MSMVGQKNVAATTAVNSGIPCRPEHSSGLAVSGWLSGLRRLWDNVLSLMGWKRAKKVPSSLVYPCALSDEQSIWLDEVCKSMHYLWFPQKLTQDIVLIRIQKICREAQTNSGGRIHIDNSCIEQGRLVIRTNLAEPDDGGRAFWGAIRAIVRVLCTTTNPEQRKCFIGIGDFNEPVCAQLEDSTEPKTESER